MFFDLYQQFQIQDYVTTYSQTELFSDFTFSPLNSFQHLARMIGYPQSLVQRGSAFAISFARKKRNDKQGEVSNPDLEI